MTDQPCTDMERYLFDLNGYLVVPNALSADELAACNATLDQAQGFVGSEFRGNVYLHKWCPEHRFEKVLISTDAEYYKLSRQTIKPGQMPTDPSVN